MSDHFPEGLLMNYHLMFKKFKKEAILAVQKAVKAGLWRSEREPAYDILRAMFTNLNTIYGLPTLVLIVDDHEYYSRVTDMIALPKPSLVSALHEYRHHMQHYGLGHYEDDEIDARGWSVSLFRKALPKSFKKAWSERKIWFMPPYPTEQE